MNEIYGKVENLHLYTDDSSIMEKFNYNAKIIDSNFMNFKITTRDDYEIAKFIVKKLDDGYL